MLVLKLRLSLVEIWNKVNWLGHRILIVFEAECFGYMRVDKISAVGMESWSGCRERVGLRVSRILSSERRLNLHYRRYTGASGNRTILIYPTTVTSAIFTFFHFLHAHMEVYKIKLIVLLTCIVRKCMSSPRKDPLTTY